MTHDGRVDLGLRIERLLRDPANDVARVACDLDSHGQRAQLARRRGDALGHLGLQHDHQARGKRRAGLEQLPHRGRR